MKILLVTPPFSEEERYGKLSAVGTLYPPLGLAYIAAIGKNQGHQVTVIESEATGHTFEEIYAEAERLQPDLIGMPTFLNTIQRCFRIADEIKKRLPRTKILLGGVQVTLNPQEAVKRDSIDYLIMGEGEKSFADLLSALEKNSPLSSVAGLAWKDKQKISFNQAQPLINDLDALPLPARELFPMERYHSSSQLRGKRTLHMMTSRGCPFRCTYCTSHMTFGKTFRFHSAKRVLEEMVILKDKYKADTIQFYDETFTLNRNRVIQLCDEIKRNKIKIAWACFTRVNLVDEELLKKMRSAGCYQIFYGVEAATQRLLNVIKKDITLEQIANAFKWSKLAGIETLASFMIGLPTETKEEALKTIDLAIKINADYAQWQKTTPFPGTELYDICEKHGKILTKDWTKFTAWNEIVYVTNGRTKEDILEVEKIAFRRFYLRPAYIIKRLPMFFKLSPKKIFNLFFTILKVSFSAFSKIENFSIPAETSNKLEYVTCALCRKDNPRIIFRERGFNIVKCAHCGLVYVNPRFSSKEYKNKVDYSYVKLVEESLRSQNPEDKNIINTGRNKFSQNEYAAERMRQANSDLIKIKKHVRDQGRILDVGCGEGYFMQAAKKQGWETQGVEVSNQHRPPDRYGLKVTTGDILEVHLPPDYFDVVTCWDTLEHMPYPDKTIKKIRTALKERGLLIIRVPNEKYLRIKAAAISALFGKDFYLKNRSLSIMGFFAPETHFYNFSQKTLSRLLEKNGFKVIKFYFGQSTKNPNLTRALIHNCIYAASKIIYFFTFEKINFNCSLIAIAAKTES